ncbi:penicillin-binding protein 2 [Thermodesulfobacteriota bacterium]
MRTSGFDPVSGEILTRRLNIATILIIVILSGLVLRLWFLQIVDGPKYKIQSENNRIDLQKLPTFRGLIMDRNGDLLVDNRPSFELYCIPEDIQDEKQLFNSIERLIPFDRNKIRQKLKKASLSNPFDPVVIKTNLSKEELAIIEANLFNLPGARTQFRPQRNYIYGSFASHVIGYLGEISEEQLKSGKYPNNSSRDYIGIYGVEALWQNRLNGIKGGEQVEVDAAGRKLRTISRKPPVPGYNIRLTIDKDLQLLAERELNGKEGAIVALDPNNGEVLVMASNPAFNPYKFVGGIDKKDWDKLRNNKENPLMNRSISGKYSPGSVFKMVVALAGLEEGVIDPEEVIKCTGTYKLGNDTKRCWKWKDGGHGKTNLHRAMRESCDVYFYEMGRRLGIDTIAQYARMFGLGKKTNIDLTSEVDGLIPDREWKMVKKGEKWHQGETLSCAIGQSYIDVTPVQMASLISTVFNGGMIYQPGVVKSVGNEKNNVFEFRKNLRGTLDFDENNMKIVKQSLIAVVNEPHGTGSRARVEGITVAGKTGSVQVIASQKAENFSPEGDIPDEFKDHAWFVAIAPVEEPRIAVAILIEHGEHGSSAAPVAKKLIEQYLGI